MKTASSQSAFAQNRIATTSGVVEGTREPGSEIMIFRGIPFAEPPIGDLRFAPPQPVRSWSGVRKADTFGSCAMQLPVFGDMSFRSNGMSEDCLYLNVWTPAKSATDSLPVLVYFYGGGNMAGDGSEPRYDGTALARRGIVALTVNYRLGVFGFFAPPPPVPAERSADYTRTANERAFQLATGQRPFSEWDNYVQSVRASGLDEWVAAAQQRGIEVGLLK